MKTGLIAAALAPLGTVAAAAQQVRAPNVVVKPVFAQITLDRSKPISWLTAQGSSTRPDLLHSGRGHTLGLSVFLSRLDIGVNYSKHYNALSDVYTVTIEELTLDYGSNRNTIYMASELEQDKCSYDTVLDHEAKHMNLSYNFFGTNAAKMKDYLAKAVAGWRPLATRDPARTVQENVDGLKAFIRPVFERFQQDMQHQQTQIDSDAEYARISASCDGHIQDIARRASH